MVALHAAIHDRGVSLLPDAFSRCVDVNPTWVSPHGWIYFAELHGSTGVIQDSLLECGIEITIVEKHVGVMKPPIEMSLHRFYRLNDTFQLLVSCEHHQCRIRARPIGLRLQAAGHKNLVVIFTYFATLKSVPITILKTSFVRLTVWLVALLPASSSFQAL